MKTKFKITFIISVLIFIGCSTTQECPKHLNLFPMYGEVKKCDKQLNMDKDFLSQCDKHFKNRNEAAQYHINKGWEYFYKDELDTAMMRFNQAWLLDSINAEVYWGFGNILGKQQKFKESIKYFERSLAKDPKNAIVWQNAAMSYQNLFLQSKDITLLNKAIDNLKESVLIDSTNAYAYGQLTACYTYFIQKDSARKYLDLTDQLNPNAINTEVRQLLSENK